MIYAELTEPAPVGATVYVVSKDGTSTAGTSQPGTPGVIQSLSGKVALIKVNVSPVAVSTGTAMGVTISLPVTGKTGLTITYDA